MTDQTRWGIDLDQQENKYKRHEQIKAERQTVYDSSNLDSKTKDRILKFVDDNSHNKTMGEIQSELKNIIHNFMLGGRQ